MVRAGLAAALLVACATSPALADGGARLAPDRVWQAWNANPLVLFNLGLLGWLYARGARRLHKTPRSGLQTLRPAQGAAFYAALAVIAVALLSPLDALGEELSSAHMVQHMLLMMVAAPLFVLGAPLRAVARSVPPAWRILMGLRWLGNPRAWQPLVGWLAFALALWGWHHPLLYRAALRDALVHDAQHLAFFLAAVLFWRLPLDPFSHRRLHPVPALAYLLTTSFHASVLGIFLALAPAPWYSDYAFRTPAFGLSPLADQQLAGLVMWIPACLIFPLAAAALVGRWLLASESVPPPVRSLAHE